MPKHHTCGGLYRRQFLASAVLPALGGVRLASAADPKAAADPKKLDGKLGVPGPYPGRVIEARNRAMIKGGVKDRNAIRATLNRGLVELTGVGHPVEAWRVFVEPGEAVGIKVVPNGHPGAPTSPELILEVIDGLRAAGIKLQDMVVFDRYGLEFRAAEYQKILPSGVAWGGPDAGGLGPGPVEAQV